MEGRLGSASTFDLASIGKLVSFKDHIIKVTVLGFVDTPDVGDCLLLFELVSTLGRIPTCVEDV